MTGPWGVISDVALMYLEEFYWFCCWSWRWYMLSNFCTLCIWTGQQCFEHAHCALHLRRRVHNLAVIELSLSDCTFSCFIKFALPQMYTQWSVGLSYQTVSAHQQHTALMCLIPPVFLQSIRQLRVSTSELTAPKAILSVPEDIFSSFSALTPGAFSWLVTGLVLIVFWVSFLSCWDWKSTILVASTNHSVSVSAFATRRFCLVSAKLHFAIQQVQAVQYFVRFQTILIDVECNIFV